MQWVQISASCHLAAAELDGGSSAPALASVHLRRAALELAQGAAAGNMRAGGRVPRGDRLAASTAPDGHRHLPPATPLPLLLHCLGAAVLRRRSAAGEAAGAAAAIALRAASAPLRGAAAHWLRRGEATLRAGMAAPDAQQAVSVSAGPLLDAATPSSELSHAFWDATATQVQLPGCLTAPTGARGWRVTHICHSPDTVGATEGTSQALHAVAEPPGNGGGGGKHVKGGVRGNTAAVAGPAQQNVLKQEKAQRAARDGFLDEAEACFCNALLLLEEEAADAASCESTADGDAAAASTPLSSSSRCGLPCFMPSCRTQRSGHACWGAWAMWSVLHGHNWGGG